MNAIGPRVDIAALLADPDAIRDGAPTLLRRSDGAGLLYGSAVNLFCGAPGSGKTWFALQAVVEVAEAGCPVWLLDYESTGLLTTERLRALGLRPDDAQNVHYHVVAGPMTVEDRHKLDRAAGEEAPVLIVIDSVAEALAAEGCDENVASEVGRWFADFVRPLARRGAAVLLLDHVVKNREGRGGWARGSGHKLAAIDGAAYGLEVVEPWHRGSSGSGALVILKDRAGHVGGHGAAAADVHVHVGDAGAQVRIILDPPAGDPAAPMQAARPAFLTPDDVAERLAHSGGMWDSLGAAMDALALSKAGARTAISRAIAARRIVEVRQGNRVSYRLPESDRLDLDCQALLAETSGDEAPMGE